MSFFPFSSRSNPRSRGALLIKLQRFGVAPRVARNVVIQHSPREIERHLAYVRHVQQRVEVDNPAGWFVRSITEQWPAPPGFSAKPRWSKWWDPEFDDAINR